MLINLCKKTIKFALRNSIILLSRIGHIDLLLLAYNQIGILNYGNNTLTGEDYFVTKILKQKIKNDPVLFDIGAHEGEYSQLLRRTFPKANIYSFEPNKDSFDVLQKIKTDHLHTFSYAASSTDGSASIYLSNNTANSQLASIYQKVLTEVHKNTEVTEQTIQTITLDTFCKKNNIDHIDFLKIDTEGHEYEVLKGATKLIANKKISVIQFEFNEMNVISRTFLKDFYDLLPHYNFYRLSKKGLIDIVKYKTINEIFKFQNITAILKKDE